MYKRVFLLLLAVALTGCAAAAGPAKAQKQPQQPRGPRQFTAADVVEKLQAKGLKAYPGDARVKALFGARSADVLSAEGIPVQVYVFDDPAAAAQGLRVASDPQANTVSWVAQPHFAQMGNLLIVVTTNDSTLAEKVTTAVQS